MRVPHPFLLLLDVEQIIFFYDLVALGWSSQASPSLDKYHLLESIPCYIEFYSLQIVLYELLHHNIFKHRRFVGYIDVVVWTCNSKIYVKSISLVISPLQARLCLGHHQDNIDLSMLLDNFFILNAYNQCYLTYLENHDAHLFAVCWIERLPLGQKL